MATPQNAVSSQCTCETRLNELTSQITKLAELVESQKKTITLLEKRVTDLECIPRSPQCGSRPSFFAATLDDSPVQTPSMPTTFAVQPPQSDDVTALESADLFKLVESCALDFLRSNPTLRQGEWCTDCEGPCTSFKLPQAEHTSTSSSAVTAPAATNNSSVSVVNVGGEQVSVDELLANPALQFLMQNPKKNGRWCKGHPETTSPENCSFVHRKHDVEGQTLLVEGTPVPLGALVRNKAVEMLLTHPVGSEGQWCHSDDATHDVTICYRVHRRENAKNGRSSPTAEQDKKRNSGGCDAGAATPTPADGYVLVADARVSVSDLKHNLAVEYLMKNPTKRGRWCSLPKDHDAAICNFVHPKADSACSSPATAAPVKAEDEATLVDENGIRCVRVGTDLIPVTRLARNPAVDYLLAHPHRRGRWCHGHGEKQIQECTFVHTKTDSTKDTTAGGTQESSSTNPSNGNTQDTLTTRMVVYYEADSPGSA